MPADRTFNRLGHREMKAGDDRLLALPAYKGRSVDLTEAAARWRAPDLSLHADDARASNVVILRRGPPSGAAPAIDPKNLLRSPGIGGDRYALQFTLFLSLSVASHLALYLPFRHEPPPMASLGEIAVSVELVLGANQQAGLIPDGGQSDVSSPAPSQAPDAIASEPPVESAAPVIARLEKPVEVTQAASVRPKQMPQAQPSEAVEPVTPQERPVVKTAAPVQTVEQPPSPAPIQAAPAPVVSGEVQVAANPEISEASPVPELEAVTPPVQVAREIPAPKERKSEKPEAEKQQQKRERRRAATRGERNDSQAQTSAARAAGGVGRGRSAADSNYRGQVAAHLARYKHFPADARRLGTEGSASVTFSIDGRGRVTSVRLTRASGVASLDSEATAMVRRASPFPAPPNGRAMNFTVPVSFRIR
jgi:protein TonB